MNKTRCAIYTRKSSEDGLEQEFNSLDAQREACAAYITSQKHEGCCRSTMTTAGYQVERLNTLRCKDCRNILKTVWSIRSLSTRSTA